MRRVPKKRTPPSTDGVRDYECTGCGGFIENNQWGPTFGHLAEDCVVVLYSKLEALTRKGEESAEQRLMSFLQPETDIDLVKIIEETRGWEPLVPGGTMTVHYGDVQYKITRVVQ